MSPLAFARRHRVIGALAASVIAWAAVGCSDNAEIWVCDNPATGKADTTVYDANHFVDGVPDPCHCYDPCGPLPQCPILVDTGPPCDAGSD